MDPASCPNFPCLPLRGIQAHQEHLIGRGCTGLEAQPESFPFHGTGTEEQTSVAKSPSVHKSCLTLELGDHDSRRRGVLRNSPHQQVLLTGLSTPIRERQAP